MEEKNQLNTNNINIQNDKEKEALDKYGFINKQDPYSSSGQIKRILVLWAIKIVKLSNLISLKSEYLGNLPYKYKSENYINDLKEKWFNQNYKNKTFHPLLLASISCNKLLTFYVFLTVFLRSIMEAIRLSLYKEFMNRFSKNPKEDNLYKYLNQSQIAFLFIFFRIIAVLIWRKSLEFQCLLGYKISNQFQCLIFEKLLKISPSSMNERIDTGQVINYIQTDSEKLVNLLYNFPELLCIPVQIFVYSYMLINILGFIFFVGAFVLIIFISFNFVFQGKLKKVISENMNLKDKRMKITTETFNNIKILKLYSWEDEFKNKINISRENELKNLEKRFKLSNLNNSIQWTGPVITSLLSIGLYKHFKGNFRIEEILTALTLFNKLQHPLRIFPDIIINVYSTIVSMRRIENYLNQDEINEDNLIINDHECIDNNIRIKITDGNFSWGIPALNENEDNQIKISSIKAIKKNIKKNENYQKLNNTSNSTEDEIIEERNKEENKIINPLIPILKNINLEIKNGEFICLIGDVGSGKSSLLQSILNNLIPLSNNSKIYLNGSIAYISQIPFISNSTVKNNILFFNEYNEEKYNKIIEISCLKPDLEILEGGDLTEIGEKGVNLSGGQKARINIARALYSDRDIYIFDDPISSLDSHVGLNIMKDCILDYLKGKTRIMATHSLQYLSYADKIIYMNNGEIFWMGTYNEIKNQDFFNEFYQKISDKIKKKEDNEENKKIEKKKNEIKEINKGIIKRITKDEKMEKDSIKVSLLHSFIVYMGGYKIPIVMLIFLSSMSIFKISSDIFLGYWSNNQNNNKKNYYMIYSFLCIGSCIFNYCLLNLTTKASIKESNTIHSLMIDSLIEAPISSFHETIPKGQIFNRLSKDIESIDNNALNELNAMLSCIINFISSLILCSYFQPYCLIFCPFLALFGYIWSKYTIKCMRELYRIEGITRSPILNITNEVIPGSIVIRAFKAEKKYLKKFYECIDEHFKVRIILNGIFNLYDICLDSITTSFIIFLVIFCVMYQDYFEPAQIGLIINYYELIHGSIFLGLHTLKNFQNTLIDFERCSDFTKCPKEREKETQLDIELNNWPSAGKITFENFSVKYREDTELVLKNLNFTINPNEKIGIIGRTGSGKSTIVLCLFRLLEPTQGKILIDDININELGLNKLRKNLTIIPQDPSLMEGTLKYNIDPLNIISENNIINIMKKIDFDYIINRNPKGLYQEILEGGNNLSVGEKQLICITRAILRKSKIIIMDEATASIDYKTEEIIQNAINEILIGSTIITIAHRIKTILNYDRILVLENGEIVDFDTSKNLIEKKNGVFYDLYQKSIL